MGGAGTTANTCCPWTSRAEMLAASLGRSRQYAVGHAPMLAFHDGDLLRRSDQDMLEGRVG